MPNKHMTTQVAYMNWNVKHATKYMLDSQEEQ